MVYKGEEGRPMNQNKASSSISTTTDHLTHTFLSQSVLVGERESTHRSSPILVFCYFHFYHPQKLNLGTFWLWLTGYWRNPTRKQSSLVGPQPETIPTSVSLPLIFANLIHSPLSSSSSSSSSSSLLQKNHI